MKTKLPLGRTIACVIAVILLITGIYHLFGGLRMRRQFYEQSKVKPVEIAVDLSQPNSYTTPFAQTWQACHSQCLELHIPSNSISGSSRSNLLSSMSFDWQIIDTDGKVVVDDKTSGSPLWYNQLDDEVITLTLFRPFPLGDYTLNFNVTTGAPALTGIEQRLVCQYHPCGLEMLAAVFAMGIGIGALVVAGVIFLVVWIITKRKNNEI